MSNANKSATYAVKPADRDGELLHVGQQCSEKSCMTVDFLPFKCQYCKESFCSDHFRPDGHKCEKYDAGMVDRIAPECPICKTPIAIPPNEDPNIRMDRHLTQECEVLTGKTKTSSVPICARSRCGKKLWTPISCDKCHQQFCTEHRYTTAHTCSAAPASGSSASTRPNAKAKLGAGQSLLSSLPARSAAASTAASAALNRFQNSATSAIASSFISPSAAGPTDTVGKTGLFTSMKRDRRAGAERKSQRLAQRERYNKGLMGKAEKARYEAELAAEEAATAKEAPGRTGVQKQSSKDDCTIM